MVEKVIHGLEGVACAASSISFINGQEGVLEYRGMNIATLAENGTFEEIAYLLLHGELPNRDQLETFTRQLAEERHLDLVEVATNGKPPVCRIMNYGKYRYEQQTLLAYRYHR